MRRMKRLVATYSVAVAALGAAVLLRWLLDAELGEYLPLVTLFGAVAVAVWYGGYRPALLVVVLGYLACHYFFIESREFPGLLNLRNLVGLIAYLVTCAFIIGLGESMRVAQRRLAEQRERLRVTLASIGDAVVTTDSECRITFLNAVAESLTGWKQDEAVGQPLDAVFRIVNAQTHQSVENPARRSLREGVVVGLANHTVLIGQKGTERPIDDSAAPIRDGQGHVVGCVLVFRDVTERRQAEQERADDEARIRSVVNNVLDGIIAIGENGTVEAFNPAAEQLFGYKAEEVIGQNIRMLMPEPFHSEHDGYLANYGRTGQAKIIGIGREVVGRRRDGTTFPMDLAVSEFWLSKRRYFTGIVRDISERKRIEKEMYNLLIELKQADRRKDEFLAILAHELRGPLAPLRNVLEIMKLTDANGDLFQRARDTMERQLSQMARLVDDLLDVSRITRNKIELRKERVELASVMQQSVEACRPLAESASHQVNVTVPPEPIYLDADPVRLIQVFSNILNNACKYTEPCGRIWLSAERQGSDVVVKVKDTGMGIPSDKLGRIFEMFMQVDRTLERSQSGLGIGLTLVKRLVEMHDGSVEVFSDGLGQGSEFVVRLPVLIEEPKVITPEPITEPVKAMARRILVVDDNRDTARLLAMLLKTTGNETLAAYDGFEAVEVAATFRPDVILMDIGMPKLNGYEAARKIREQPWGKDIVLIALTGWDQEADRQKSSDAGFNGHLVKPAEHEDIMKLLAELLPTPI
jgi:PAS domain S-box-containing protein